MTTDDAPALAALVRESAVANIARDVLHVGIGTLPAPLRQPHHERLIEEALAPALGAARGRLFTLPNGDLVVVAPPGGAQLAAARHAVAALFGGVSTPPVLALWRLPAAAAELLALLEATLAPWMVLPTRETTGRFRSTELAQIERALIGASLDAYLRRGRVCRLAPGDAEPKPLWTELAIDTAALHAALLPGSDPATAPALERRLRRLLDRRLLAELARPEEAARLGPAGLSLLLGSVGEPAFQRLDAALGSAGRARLVLWFAAADLLADATGWSFVRSYADARGYRLGLDASSPATAALLPPERIGVAMTRLRWRPDLPPPTEALPPGLPADRVVLSGADRAAAIGWGWAAGITCFEGRVLPRPAEA